MTSGSAVQPGFMLIQGNRLEALCDLMTAWVREHPLRPLESEVVLVQSNGIGQWLKLALAAPPDDPRAGGWGIAAAVDLSLPARFVWQAYRAVLGSLPDISAYEKTPLTWRFYRLLGDLDALAGNSRESSWLEALRGFLSADADPRRRYQLAERLADLFDQYQVYRADWLEAWSAGKDVLIRPDGRTEALAERQRWQPLLWRRLRQERTIPAGLAETGAEIGAELDATASRAEIHQRFLAEVPALSAANRPATLPRRVIVFGISSLPRQAIDVLHGISRLSQVMLFVHNPCRHYWGDIVEGRELFREAYRRHAARKVPDALAEDELHLHGHPLLAAWGKQGRDYIRLLDQFDTREDYESAFTAQGLAIDLFESPAPGGLLQQLQDDILELRPLAERRELRAAIDPETDHSLRFLIAHSPQREVEILHDQLLAAFADADAACAPLAPRDILVMVPQIETYAPHIEAVFGRLAADDPRFIPFSLADQGPRRCSPLLLGLERLLNLPRSRCSATEVLDLLDIGAVQARFGLQAAELPSLRRWMMGANIRWGLNAEHRQLGFALPPGLAQNTWRFGLERILLGVAAGAAGAWRGIEPYDEVAGLEAAVIGPLAALLQRLEQSWQRLREARTPSDWSRVIAGLLDDFFRPVSDADQQGLSLVLEALERWVLDCTAAGLHDEPIPLDVVRDALLASLDEPSLTRRFLAGAVNFATLMPMRAVPFRQIWLLGMNDGDYPRTRRRPDFDLMASDYRPGDRSRREDDRYLFLEALLSARERLVISWVGRSIRDNTERPPSVLVGQLCDHIAAGWSLETDASGTGLLDALTTEHPLQPFSRRYLAPDRPPELFTYAAEWAAGWAAEWADAGPTATQAADSPPLLSAAVFQTPVQDAPVTLAELAGFLRHPVKTFYRRRLGAHLELSAEHAEDEEPFALDPLGRWALSDAILAEAAQTLLVSALRADTRTLIEAALGARARAGQLPLPPFDQVLREELEDRLFEPLQRFQRLVGDGGRVLPVEPVSLAVDEIRLEDSLSPIYATDDPTRLRVILQASNLERGGSGKNGEALNWTLLVRHWPAHLAAQLRAPTRTRLLGPGGEILLRPLDAPQAMEHLSALIAAYRRGLTELLPLACKTAFAVLEADADPTARSDPPGVYEGNARQSGECADHPAYRRFWPQYAQLIEDDRFAVVSDQVYRPLFDHLAQHGGADG